jgi:hypothetical protein
MENDENENENVQKNQDFSRFFEDHQDEQLNVVEDGGDVNFMEMAQMGMNAKSQNLYTINTALRFLESSFFWRFKSNKKRVELLIKAYNLIDKIVEKEEEE